MTNKVCSKCKDEKAVSDFNKRFNKGRDIGYKSHCKKCCNDSLKKWTARPGNRDRLKKLYKKYYEARMLDNIYREKEAARHREARKKDPDRFKEITKKYRQQNPEKQVAKLAKRRARKKHACPAWLTKAQHKEMIDMYKQAKELEAIFFNRKFHVDHIVPLQGKDVCGLHVPWNLQILTAEENITKSNNHG